MARRRVLSLNQRSPAPSGTLGLGSCGRESLGFGRLGRGTLTPRRKRARFLFFPSWLLCPLSPGAFLPPESPPSGSLTNRRLCPPRSPRPPVPSPLQAGP